MNRLYFKSNEVGEFFELSVVGEFVNVVNWINWMNWVLCMKQVIG